MNLELLKEEPLSFLELKEKLAEMEKRDSKLNFRANRVKEYIDVFATLDRKIFSEAKKKIEELAIPRLKDRHIIKILDIMPRDLDGLKILFVGENITIKQEDLQKVLDVVKKY